MIPRYGPSAARLKVSLTSSTVVSRPSTTARSVSEPSSTGTRSEMPSSRPFSSGMARYAALAAPVEVGMVLTGRAGPAQVLVGEVEDDLVVGVGVDGRHEAAFDAELVQQDLGHRHHRVGGAGGVG